MRERSMSERIRIILIKKKYLLCYKNWINVLKIYDGMPYRLKTSV
jgi:hypothetical protein